jgi:hypothetical protein
VVHGQRQRAVEVAVAGGDIKIGGERRWHMEDNLPIRTLNARRCIELRARRQRKVQVDVAGMQLHSAELPIDLRMAV